MCCQPGPIVGAALEIRYIVYWLLRAMIQYYRDIKLKSIEASS